VCVSAITTTPVCGVTYLFADLTPQISKHFVNPKAVTLGQLYGEFDAGTREWNDGVLSRIVRLCSRDPDMSQSALLMGAPSPMNNPTITPKGSVGTMWSDESGLDVHHWIVLDGPVDPIWIENLNTVSMTVFPRCFHRFQIYGCFLGSAPTCSCLTTTRSCALCLARLSH
jgi:hypothetical protein